MENKMMICVECDCEFTLEDITENDKREIMEKEEICEDCFDDNYTMCNECGEYVKDEEINYIQNRYDDEEMYVCEYCLSHSDNIFWCDYHMEYEFGEYRDVTNYGTVCMSAIEDSCEFNFCERCEEYYHEDNAMWDDYNECYYCENCYEEVVEGRLIKRYHHHQDNDDFYEILKTKEDKNKKSLSFGVELEVEANSCRCDNEATAKRINEATDLFVYEYDGSLDDGFEMISRPFTMNYLNEFAENEIKDALSILENSNYSSDNDTCGFHIHIGRDELENSELKLNHRDVVLNIALITEMFQRELRTLSRREDREVNRWASFYFENKDEVDIEELRYKLNEANRYHTINDTNLETLEFRINRGTLNHNIFMATIELIANICEYARENIIDEYKLENLNFNEIATYKYNNFIGRYIELMLSVATN